MKLRLANRFEIDSFFQEAFNPPIYDTEFTEADFDDEYWKTHAAVRIKLQEIGKFSNLGVGDFAMNESRGVSRWLSVDLTTTRMWSKLLINAVSSALSTIQQDYMVYVSHELPEYPLFHLLIAKDESLGCCEDHEDLPVLQCFGFERSP